MIKETLEEAAKRIAYDSTEANKGFPSMEMFKAGAKWQAERMYSEKELLLIVEKTLIQYTDIVLADIPNGFKLFQKI
jgi:hypothetical protein